MFQESPALIPESSNNHSDREFYPNIDSLLDDNLNFDTEKNGIIRSFSNHDERVQQDEIKLVIGIDGLPISRSSSNQFWPILAYVRSKFNIVFPVGLYFGTEKPMDSNDFLKDFVNEATHLVSNDVFCCDTPAKAFILKIKGHNGFSSCARCEIEGEYKENRLCFPYSDVSNREVKRTHDNYLNRTDTNHYSSVTSISSVVDISGVNVVFPLYYMHLVTLGVMKNLRLKKLILLWMEGPLNVRLPSSKIKQISNLLLSFRSKFPCEFSRKPRALEEVLRWKATEFRSFLFYIGHLVLKSIVSKDCFKNFMALNIAMTILLSPNLGSLIQYADDLLNYFVLTFEQIFGQYLMSSNNNNNGPLLVGCVNPQFNTLVLENYKIKCKVDADSYFSSKTNDIIKLINFAHSNVTGSIILIGRKFESKELFYDKSIQSSYFGIYTVKNVSKNLSTWTINDIQRKVMLLSMNIPMHCEIVSKKLKLNEDIQNKTRRKKHVVEDAAIFTGLSNTDVLSISLSDYPKSNMPDNINLTCPTLEVRKKLFHTTTSATSSQKDFLIPSFNNEQKYNVQNLSSTVSKTSDVKTNELHHDYRIIDVPTRNPKDYDRVEDTSSPNLFDFKNDSLSDTNDSIDKKQKSTVIHTTSSPFKLNFDRYLVLNICMFTPSSSSVHRSLNRNCTTPNTILNVSDTNDTLKKILSVVLKIKYDIENLTHNQNRMDKILNDLLTNNSSVINQGDSVTIINDDNDYSFMLPLHNEDELSDFENRLLKQIFQIKCCKLFFILVNSLKHLVKNTLTSTIRQILRIMFDDELLQIYSYVGQKKKKIFSSLASCAIIFEAIRSMKHFHDVPNSHIETPIKIYIAGAAFHQKKKK
ncbi:Uncharacterized protein FWK35_00011549 [Aphis craccivora]|uniref:DUF4806 domain-containing protein n=1 Tax=Aphis craccivora TaxID=307492 RepID=A0A6G0YAZ9_APHCR|nr:Uncharacterized protein FWK35_00011549 [Aphis craccivora]